MFNGGSCGFKGSQGRSKGVQGNFRGFHGRSIELKECTQQKVVVEIALMQSSLYCIRITNTNISIRILLKKKQALRLILRSTGYNTSN